MDDGPNDDNYEPLSRLDGIPHLNDSFRENLSTESAAMDQPTDDSLLRQPFESRARLTELDSFESDSSHLEFFADEMIERDALRHDIAA